MATPFRYRGGMDVALPFDRLPEFLRWANTKVLASLEALAEPPDPARRWFAHVLAAEELWLARLQGRPAGLSVWPDEEPAVMRPWIDRNARGYADHLAGLGSADLWAEITYTNSQGVAHRSRVADVLLHVIAHGTHHRGQIAVEVRGAGGRPAATDYIFFARGGS